MTTGIAKFGTNALEVAGRQRIEVKPSPDFNFTNKDFTVDMWILPHVGDNISPFAWYLNGSNYFSVAAGLVNGTQVEFRVRYRRNGVNIIDFQATAPTTMFDGTYRHLLIQDAADATRLFQHGIHAGSQSQPSTRTVIDLSTWVLYIGMGVDFNTGQLVAFDGHIDEFRIANEVIAPANFTPKTTPYVRTIISTFIGSSAQYNTVVSGFSFNAGSTIRNISRQFNDNHKRVGAVSKSFADHNVLLNSVSSGFSMNHGITIRNIRSTEQEKNIGRNDYVVPFNDNHAIHSVMVTMPFDDRAIQYNDIQSNQNMNHRALFGVNMSFDDRTRIENTAVALFELYHNLGSLPDFVTPLDTSPTLPIVSSAITGEGIHYFVLRRRDKYNQVSRNIEAVLIELDGSDNEIVIRPTGPFFLNQKISDVAANEVTVESYYNHGVDHDNPADQWVVYTSSNGIIDPGLWPDDGSSPQAQTVPMVVVDGIAKITLPGTVLILGDYFVGVRTKRSSDGRLSATIQKLRLTAGQVAGSGDIPIPPQLEFVQ